MKKVKRIDKNIYMVLTLVLLFCSCGSKIKNGFVEENGNIYYYVNDEMKTGWIKENNDYYYFDNDGVMKTGWFEENGFWYYLDDNGKMYKGKLLFDKEKVYYFDSNGQMLTNVKKMINGWEYTFDSSGEGTKIDGNMYLNNVKMTSRMGVPIEKSSFMLLGDHEGENFVIDITYSTMYQSATCNINVGTFDTNTFANIKSFIFPVDFLTDDGIVYTVISNNDSQLPNVLSKIRDGIIKYIRIYNKYTYKLLISPEEKTEAYERYMNNKNK